MASKEKRPFPHDPKHINSVARFAHDVLWYTLPKCGLPVEGSPTTDVKENVYRRPDFVKTAGVSALRVALIMRDKWKRMFASRQKTSGLDDESIPLFLRNVARCCLLSRDETLKTMVEVILALCNEILLFLCSENIAFSTNTVISLVSVAILSLIEPGKNVLETLEELFDRFDDIEEYSRWITEFMTKFAIPYGSREDVSDLFFEEVKKRHIKEIERVMAKATPRPEEPSITKLKDHLGFLPHDLYSAIMTEESVSLPEDLMLASGSTLPGDRVSPEPPNLPQSFEERKSRCRRPTRPGKTSEESRPILPTKPPKSHASSESGGVEENKPRRRRPTRSKKTSEESVPLPKNLASVSGPVLLDEPPKLHASSESGAVGGNALGSKRSTPSQTSEEARPKSHASSGSGEFREKNSGRSRTIRSRRASEQTTQSQQSRKDSSELGIEDELRRMSLGTEGVSCKNEGAIPKKKEPEK